MATKGTGSGGPMSGGCLGLGPEVSCPLSGGGGLGVPMSLVWSGVRAGVLYSEVQYIMGNGHIETPCPLPDRIMDWHDWRHYLSATSLAGSYNVHHGLKWALGWVSHNIEVHESISLSALKACNTLHTSKLTFRNQCHFIMHRPVIKWFNYLHFSDTILEIIVLLSEIIKSGIISINNSWIIFLYYVTTKLNLDIPFHWRIQGGRQGRAPPRGSKFFHFHAVFGKIINKHTHFGSWRPPWGKS